MFLVKTGPLLYDVRKQLVKPELNEPDLKLYCEYVKLKFFCDAVFTHDKHLLCCMLVEEAEILSSTGEEE